jgi:hypothetical protein
MRHVWSRLLIVATAVAALVPASSAGAPAAASATLFTTPFVYKGYSWSLVASNTGGKSSLLISATKHAGGATQTHIYTFQSGVSFTASPTLSSANLVAHLGQYGTIRARFRGAGALTLRGLPPPCKGPKFSSRAGSLSGFAFVADTTFFKRVAKAPVAATVGRLGAGVQLNCGGPVKPPTGALSLSGSATTGGIVSVSATKTAAGAVTQSVSVFEEQAKTAPATVFHTITTPAPTGSFTAAPDLSSASVNAVGPFLSGTLSFTASGASGNTAAGTLSGNYTAKFDVIGPQSPAAAGDLPGVLTRS